MEEVIENPYLGNNYSREVSRLSTYPQLTNWQKRRELRVNYIKQTQNFYRREDLELRVYIMVIGNLHIIY